MPELESMKYFSELQAQEVENELNNQQPRDPEELASASQLGMSEWTFGLTVVTVVFGLFGLWGVFGALLDFVRIATLESMLAYYQKLGGIGDMRLNIAYIETQIDQRIWLYVLALVRLVVGGMFLAAAAFLKVQKEDANRFAAFVCIGAVFYGLVSMLVTYSLMPTGGEIPGLTQEAAQVFSMAMVIGMVVGFGIRMAIYGGLMFYLLNGNNRRLFGKRVNPLDVAYQGNAEAMASAVQ